VQSVTVVAPAVNVDVCVGHAAHTLDDDAPTALLYVPAAHAGTAPTTPLLLVDCDVRQGCAPRLVRTRALGRAASSRAVRARITFCTSPLGQPHCGA
jgi:hypothetical protein